MAECQVQIPSVEGLEDHVLTVGREFVLDCHGDFSKLTDPAEWSVQLTEKQDPLSIKILRIEGKTAGEAKFVVTSYRVGSHNFEPLEVKGGQEKINLGKVAFQVESVLGKENIVQEPYGPMAAKMSFPVAFWLAAGLIAASVIAVIYLKVRRYNERRALLEQLSRHDSPVSPLSEIHQNYRRWRRQHAFYYLKDADASRTELMQVLGEVDHAFRVYLIRSFKIPALQWSNRLILKEMKKYHRLVYKDFGQELKKYIIEIDKAKEAADRLKSQDLVQLTENLRLLIEKIERRGAQKRRATL